MPQRRLEAPDLPGIVAALDERFAPFFGMHAVNPLEVLRLQASTASKLEDIEAHSDFQ
jgi:hypothetical protein